MRIWGKEMIRKGLAVAVISLFISVALAPTINASVVKEELVEFDIEFYGIGKKHTVSLTQQEAEEVEQLFDDIEQRLSDVETREEAEVIFNDAIVELDKLGLFIGLNNKQIKKISNYKHINEEFKGNLNKNPVTLNDNSNSFCMLVGKADNTKYPDILSFLFLGFGFINTFSIVLIYELFPDLYESIISIFPFLENVMEFITFFPILWATLKPFRLLGIITFGRSWVELSETLPIYHRPSNGWIFTSGLNGIKEWNGSFYGSIGKIGGSLGSYYLGVIGFTGIKISQGYSGKIYFLGNALRVNIEYE